MKNTPLTIVNVGYRSTNYWVISVGHLRLLVDLGYPGTFGSLQANLRRMDIPLNEIRYALATHYHIDHAGLAQDLKQHGVPLLVFETQLAAIPQLKRWTKPGDGYREITLHDNHVLSFEGSHALLAGMGIDGKVLPTPGHSDDSVSLLLASGEAFTGDLTPPTLATDDQAALVAASWQRLREQGARQVYPGHGPVYPLPALAAT